MIKRLHSFPLFGTLSPREGERERERGEKERGDKERVCEIEKESGEVEESERER